MNLRGDSPGRVLHSPEEIDDALLLDEVDNFRARLLKHLFQPFY